MTRSAPCAAAVAEVMEGEAEAGSPGRRPGTWTGGDQSGSLLVRRAWPGP